MFDITRCDIALCLQVKAGILKISLLVDLLAPVVTMVTASAVYHCRSPSYSAAKQTDFVLIKMSIICLFSISP